MHGCGLTDSSSLTHYDFDLTGTQDLLSTLPGAVEVEGVDGESELEKRRRKRGKILYTMILLINVKHFKLIWIILVLCLVSARIILVK